MVKTVPSNVWAAGLIPSQGATIPQESESVSRSVVSDPMHVVCQAPLSMKISGQEYTYLAAKNENIKQKQHCNKFNKDLKNGLHKKIFLKIKKKIALFNHDFLSCQRFKHFYSVTKCLPNSLPWFGSSVIDFNFTCNPEPVNYGTPSPGHRNW